MPSSSGDSTHLQKLSDALQDDIHTWNARHRQMPDVLQSTPSPVFSQYCHSKWSALSDRHNDRAPSVQIHVRYEDNMMTMWCLRCLSGRPADSTMYTMLTGQPDNIK